MRLSAEQSHDHVSPASRQHESRAVAADLTSDSPIVTVAHSILARDQPLWFEYLAYAASASK